MEGVFETRSAEALLRREAWKLTVGPDGAALSTTGLDKGARDRSWQLDARLSPAGAFQSVDLQVTPAPPPTEITTTVLRMFGGRAFGTTIPPEGVPEKFETAFDASGAVRGFSALLDGLVASALGLKVGHGRRVLVVDLETGGLRPRLRDGLLLCKARTRLETPAGSQWCNTFDLRWADQPGRTETTFVVGKAGVVVSATHAAGATATVTQLVEYRE